MKTQRDARDSGEKEVKRGYETLEVKSRLFLGGLAVDI